MSFNMSLVNISDELNDKLCEDLELSIENKFNMGPKKIVYAYNINDNDEITIPFSYAIQYLKIKRPKRQSFPSSNYKFILKPREEQTEVLGEAIQYLNKNGSIIISCYTGFGKTACSISLAATIKLKTLIIVNKIVLIKQWEESINKFCPEAIVQKLTVKSKRNDEANFYIMNAQNIEKMGVEYFSQIGCVIVDECHLIMAESLSKSLQYLYPRYLIGLSATPYRPDGLNSLLDLYFGEHKIIRKLHREHIAYKVETNIIPNIEYSITGKINWGAILDSQANNDDRNNIIANIIRDHADRNFLVITKRISQGEYLYNLLSQMGENVTSLLGTNQEFDKDARILIGTSSKVGVGFDHQKLDALLLACDIEEYFIQYLGRVFRTKDTIPIIFDLVDKYSVLEKHWKTRNKIYKEHGGIVKKYDINR